MQIVQRFFKTTDHGTLTLSLGHWTKQSKSKKSILGIFPLFTNTICSHHHHLTSLRHQHEHDHRLEHDRHPHHPHRHHPDNHEDEWGGNFPMSASSCKGGWAMGREDNGGAARLGSNLQPPQKATNLLKMRAPIHQAEIGCRTSEILVFVFAYGVKS